MSNTPAVTRSGASYLVGEGRFIFVTTLLEVALLARVVAVGTARLAMMTELISALATYLVFLARRKFLAQSD